MSALQKGEFMRDRKRIALICRRARFRLGLTQAQMANHFGVEQSTISRWERGLQAPSPGRLKMLEQIRDNDASPAFIRLTNETPVPSMLTSIHDVMEVLTISPGAAEMIEKSGGTLDAFLDKDDPTPLGKALQRHVFEDPRWLSGDVSFAIVEVETCVPPSPEHFPVHIVAMPLPDAVTLLQAVFKPIERGRVRLYMDDGEVEEITL